MILKSSAAPPRQRARAADDDPFADLRQETAVPPQLLKQTKTLVAFILHPLVMDAGDA